MVDRLVRIIAALGDVQTPQDVAEVLVSAVTPEFDIPAAGVWLVQGDELVVAAARWTTEEDRDRFSSVPLDSDLPGAQVYRTGVPIWVDTREESLHAYRAMAVPRGFFVLPLMGSKGCAGVFGGTGQDPETFTAEERTYISTITALCGQAIERTASVVTERETRHVLEFLAEATRLMVAELEPTQVLHSLVRLGASYLSPWCAVYLAQGDVLVRAALAIEGGELLAGEVLRSDPVPLDADVPLTRVLRSGRSEVMEEVPAALVQRTVPPSRFPHGSRGRRWSALIVPVVARSRTVGVLSLASDSWDRSPPDALRFAAEGLATRAGMAFDAAQRYQGQRDLVEMFTNAFLPVEVPTIEGLRLATSYIPAVGRVCGDWYDVIVLDDGDALVGLGDAMGHGVEASSRMAKLRYSARAVAAIDPRPATVLGVLSRTAAEERSIATALYARVDPRRGEMLWSSAGHLPPFLVHESGAVEELRAPETVILGAVADRPYRQYRAQLRPGDVVIAFSDGVVERRRVSIDEGTARLRRTIAEVGTGDMGTLLDEIVARHCAHPEDDCCILTLQWSGTASPAGAPTDPGRHCGAVAPW